MTSYNMTCWQGSSGHWYCNDVKNLNNNWSSWFAPMRILHLSIEEYITLLIDKFHAKNLSYENNYLHYYFSKERDAKAFCAFVNRAFKSYR